MYIWKFSFFSRLTLWNPAGDLHMIISWAGVRRAFGKSLSYMMRTICALFPAAFTTETVQNKVRQIQSSVFMSRCFGSVCSVTDTLIGNTARGAFFHKSWHICCSLWCVFAVKETKCARMALSSLYSACCWRRTQLYPCFNESRLFSTVGVC